MSIESRIRQYGTIFDHYQIRESLGSGSGGKSQVFRLKRVDAAMGDNALKIISLIEEKGSRGHLPDFRREEYERARSECKQMAEREVVLMDSLSGNTNIVDYKDHGFVDWEDDNGFGCDMMIRMELLTVLRSKMRADCPLFEEQEIIKLGKDICTALMLCHSKGILHRDIKPENIFINRDGNYKLGDFGISRILDDASTITATTGVCTLEYAPAEQISGSYDKRVDIYSLGLVLYELGNGNRLPFAKSVYANGREVRRRLDGKEPIPMPKGVSEGLGKLILKACAHKPEDRYQTAEELFEALRAVETEEESVPGPLPGIVICHECGEENPEERVYCRRCGMPLADDPEESDGRETIRCAHCGTANDAEREFCIKCFKRLDSQPKLCPYCGTVVRETDDQCPWCLETLPKEIRCVHCGTTVLDNVDKCYMCGKNPRVEGDSPGIFTLKMLIIGTAALAAAVWLILIAAGML